MRLIVLLVAWPLIEIAGLVIVGGWIGLWPTLAIVVGTGIWGVSLLRGGGLRSVSQLRGQVRGMRGDLAQAAQGAMRILAGLLLILPGFLGDLLGLALLIPPVQALVLQVLGAWIAAFAARMAARAEGPGRPAAGAVIDGDFDVVEEEKKPTHMPSGWTRH